MTENRSRKSEVGPVFALRATPRQDAEGGKKEVEKVRRWEGGNFEVGLKKQPGKDQNNYYHGTPRKITEKKSVLFRENQW
jgi:hypothetical protein